MSKPVWRAVLEDDGPALLDILGQPAVARWLRAAGRDDPFSAAECAARARAGMAHWRAHDLGPWLVLDGRRPIACGGLGFTLLDGRAELEIVWAVIPDRQGQGLATAIGREALALAADRKVRRIVATTRADNHASRRVMDKLGMMLAAELEHAGHPHVLYRIDIG